MSYVTSGTNVPEYADFLFFPVCGKIFVCMSQATCRTSPQDVYHIFVFGNSDVCVVSGVCMCCIKWICVLHCMCVCVV